MNLKCLFFINCAILTFQERVQMSDQYKTKVRKLTEELRRLEQEKKDSMQVLNCREEELLARKDMLLWEKNNEKVQVRYSRLISCMTL